MSKLAVTIWALLALALTCVSEPAGMAVGLCIACRLMADQ